MYTLSDFDFKLPSDLIAQEPTKKRDESKLLVSYAKKKNNIIAFHQIIDHVQKNDILIFNDSRVINAQLALSRDGKKINVNLNKPLSDNLWLGFAKPAKRLKIGDEFIFGNNKIYIKNKRESGDIEFEFRLNNISIFDFLDIYGQVPLPQYIKRDDNSYADDLERYQTVYSKTRGSVAAATAGLHFTEELIEKIKQKGVKVVFVTLHVGAGTFLPVKTENISEHKMHSEWCQVSQEAADTVNKAKRNGDRIIIIGTTAMRTVESCAENGILFAKVMNTNIFITPGYRFQIADMLLTNFHLPKSTLFMLVCAFAGFKEIHSMYQFAIDNRMRFFSYGDAMLINKNSM